MHFRKQKRGRMKVKQCPLPPYARDTQGREFLNWTQSERTKLRKIKMFRVNTDS
jgi:hypothetical protein